MEYRDSGHHCSDHPTFICLDQHGEVLDILQRPNVLVPTASTFVSNAVHTLGYARRTSGYWAHGIQVHMAEKFGNKWLFMYFNYLWNSFLLRNMKKNQSRSR
nr:inactive hydroxysteroid dehydrogenase-like protein 1 [Cherax quadricarinatus]